MKNFLSCLLLLSAAVFPWIAQATTASLLSVYTTDNVPQLTLGYCDQFGTCNGGQLTFNGSTSGATILKPTAAAGSGTLTMPTATGTLMATGNANTFDQTTTFNSGVTFNSPVTHAAGSSDTFGGTTTFNSGAVFNSPITNNSSETQTGTAVFNSGVTFNSPITGAAGGSGAWAGTQTFTSGVTFSSPITGASGASGNWAGAQTFSNLLTASSTISSTSTANFNSGIAIVDTHYQTVGQTLTTNPLVQSTAFNITTASANAGIPILSSVSGRSIYPIDLTIMASGTASGATSVIVNCGLAGVGGSVATFPIANLVNQLPVTPFFVSASAITRGVATAQGCGSSNALMLSVNGTLATTTNLFGVVSYIVQ